MSYVGHVLAIEGGRGCAATLELTIICDDPGLSTSLPWLFVM